MFIKFFSYWFNKKITKQFLSFYKIVQKINLLEPIYNNYTDIQLKENTYRYRDLLLSGKKNKFDLLPEVYANVREASKRILSIRHFDVQLLGGIILYHPCIAEMKTGEGKTITSTLVAYLNALEGKGVHIVTINEYLAKRDYQYNSVLFKFLGLTVGLNLSNMTRAQKQKAYLADITYSTNSEYGFDYLRDHMVNMIDNKVQRTLYYALLDEVDCILIDEARTPLIISGSINNDNKLLTQINNIIHNLILQDKDDTDTYQGIGDFVIDEKNRQISLTERGIIKIENLLVINKIINIKNKFYNLEHINIMHHVIMLLKAYYLYKKNIDYIIKDNKILIVDEHTGRVMLDRRWSDGLHQAIEIKECVDVKQENKILASITYQNYFRLYKKISGMTGTALTEAYEFKTIYGLDTLSVPTNEIIIRKDLSDLIFLTEREKIQAIIYDIKQKHLLHQPILVGTLSIEKSELISNELKKIGIKHNILNAKFHASEAFIISQAGKLGSVTIATNMAGRGTDIVLGGNLYAEIASMKHSITKKQYKLMKEKWILHNNLVKEKGGLYVMGTERHESRRIDNQLRGRSGRQGDPGITRFYISLEDPLIRLFSTKNIIVFMRNIGVQYGESLEHPWLNRAIEKAQQKVENRNFDYRKQLLEYDDIINNQRMIIYQERDRLLNLTQIRYIFILYEECFIDYMLKDFSDTFVYDITSSKYIYKKFWSLLKIKLQIRPCIGLYKYQLKQYLILCMHIMYNIKLTNLGESIFYSLIQTIMLENLDMLWKEYLSYVENLRDSIYLRGYAEKDPKLEYKIETFKVFTKMLSNYKLDVVRITYSLPINIYDINKYIYYTRSLNNFS